MIRHQTVRMHRAIVLFGQSSQVRQIHEVVGVAAETSRTVVSALDNVQRYAGQDQAQGSRHARDNGCLVARVDEIGL